jgi:phage FluMu gp28-like protein
MPEAIAGTQGDLHEQSIERNPEGGTNPLETLRRRAASTIDVTKKATTQRRKGAKTFTREPESQSKIGTADRPAESVDYSAAQSPGFIPDRADIATANIHDQDRTPEQKAQAAQLVNEAMVKFRPYQNAVFMDRESGILILHWSRQIGKSFTLASWAVDRLLTQLPKYDSWLITVLSNSRDNGAEFVIKCQEVCNKIGMALAKPAQAIGDANVYTVEDSSPDLKYENMRMEVRITLTVNGREHVGRIKVLAANPRTARGFSGDLILDEFAFHEDSNAIWEAAEPILSANPEFLCRIASTGNGKHNMFYRMAAGIGPNNGQFFQSASGFKVCRVTRSEAWKMGVKIYDPNTRKPIAPEEARQKALDKRAYDQNYECLFNDENMALLTHELIQQAEREGIPIDDQKWSPVSMARLWRAEGDLSLGGDIGRNRDITVFAVLEKIGQTKRIIAMLRMSGMRLPAQQEQLDLICALPKFQRAAIDMTGIGLGLVEYAQEKWGEKIVGVNFSTTEPINDHIRAEGRKAETAKVTEIMATDLLAAFEERSIEIHVELDADGRDDLRKPEKITSPGGRVSIAAVRDEAGHADHFWAFALAIRAALLGETSGAFSEETIAAMRADNSPSRLSDRAPRQQFISRRLT